MPAVPAICDTCGSIFPSGIFVENSLSITFRDCHAGPCPKCGQVGHLVEGTFNFVGETIEVVRASFKTQSELIRLKKFIQKIKQEAPKVEEAIREIQDNYPQLSKPISLLPKTTSELYAFLGLLIALLTYIQIQWRKVEPSSTFINNVYNNFYAAAPSLPEAVPSKTKIGRNEKCPCGSGKKFKRCCGSNL
jgi:uncharacterized protein YecA (UPF0149 family)